MLLAERAGRELEPPSNWGPRGMTVIPAGLARQGHRIRPIGLLHFSLRARAASLLRFFPTDSFASLRICKHMCITQVLLSLVHLSPSFLKAILLRTNLK